MLSVSRSQFLEKTHIPCLLQEWGGTSTSGYPGTTFIGGSMTSDLEHSTLQFLPNSLHPGLCTVLPGLHTRGNLFYCVFLRIFFSLKSFNVEFLSPGL